MHLSAIWPDEHDSHADLHYPESMVFVDHLRQSIHQKNVQLSRARGSGVLGVTTNTPHDQLFSPASLQIVKHLRCELT